MDRHPRRPACVAMTGAALAALLAGCAAEPRTGFERYVPTSESARANLAHAMEGWLQGKTPADSGRTKPEVHVVDQTRRADQKLEAYEILGEAPAENARAFDVRVRYAGKEEPEIVRFVAFGVDPMWIFRREDYETIWQHDPEPPPDRVGEAAKKP